MDFLLAGFGLLILLLAGDALVRGAVSLAFRLGIPALIVGLTIVAFGTSAPEMLISVRAVIGNAPGLALGNVVGSNTANILLVLGLPAMIARLDTAGHDTRKSYSAMIAASLVFIVLCFFGPITWVGGILLLVMLAAILAEQTQSALRHRRAQPARDADEAQEAADPHLDGWKIALFLGFGLVGLPIGADLLVDSSMAIARRFGVSDTLIGLTLVALGTSLPELATTAMAAYRRQADVALGNVIGSNMFNLLSIIGIASFFGRIPVAETFLRFDLWVMLGASVLIAPFVFSKRLSLTRRWGFALTSLYVLYVIVLIYSDRGTAA